MNKKGVIPFVVWAVMGIVGLVAGGFFFSQASKSASAGWLGIPIIGWIAIVLVLLIIMRRR